MAEIPAQTRNTHPSWLKSPRGFYSTGASPSVKDELPEWYEKERELRRPSASRLTLRQIPLSQGPLIKVPSQLPDPRSLIPRPSP